MGDKWDALTENGFVEPEFTEPGWEFATASGKFEFVSPACKAGGEKAAAQIAIEGDENAYPLVLFPYNSIRLANGFIANPPFLTKTVPDTVLKGNDLVVEINPKTAKSRFLYLNEGDTAILSTPKGEVKVRVHLFEGIMPGYVGMPRGLGHTAYDSYLAGKGANVNAVMGPVEDPVSGLDAAWGIRVKLTNVPI
jgi:anaerobic selenocysteine-containing dehydrogenase